MFGAEFSREQAGDKDASDPGRAVGVGDVRWWGQGRQHRGLHRTAIRVGIRSSGSHCETHRASPGVVSPAGRRRS